jgi:uncharacterized protein YjbI with pentapeptide repeats
MTRKDLKPDCENCFGLCCTALNLLASSDFPISKPAGQPCINLQTDYRCQIHGRLRDEGFKGCTVFDCLGSGQAVSQVTFQGLSWRENPEIREKMFQVFPVMEQVYEMIAYVTEILTYDISDDELTCKLIQKLEELQTLTESDADQLLSLDLVMLRTSISGLLITAGDTVRKQTIDRLKGQKRNFDHARVDWMGKDLQGQDLRATDFRGAFLIAANLRSTDLRAVNFIGADLRDADFSGANLSTAMFLTQMQINSAKGDMQTLLPDYIQRPAHWTSKTSS